MRAARGAVGRGGGGVLRVAGVLVLVFVQASSEELAGGRLPTLAVHAYNESLCPMLPPWERAARRVPRSPPS